MFGKLADDLIHQANVAVYLYGTNKGYVRAGLYSLPHDARLLWVLRDGKWHTNSELADIVGHRFGGTISVLRGKGVDIRKQHVKGGLWEYRLAREGNPLMLMDDEQVTYAPLTCE